MAQRTVVTVVCDLPHDDEVEGKETVSFSIDGSAFEIDLCTKHARELHDKVGAFADHARKPGTAGPGRRRKARTGPVRERSSDIRAWARERGDKVSERGRIPASIIRDYEAAH